MTAKTNLLRLVGVGWSVVSSGEKSWRVELDVFGLKF